MLRLRRQSAMLNSPSSRHRRRRILPSRRDRRTGNIGPHRRSARRAARLSIASTRRKSAFSLVATEQRPYRPAMPLRSGERDVVVLICDFRSIQHLAGGNLPQDLLYLLKLYVEETGTVIRRFGGTLSYVEFDRICAFFWPRWIAPLCRKASAAGSRRDRTSDFRSEQSIRASIRERNENSSQHSCWPSCRRRNCFV